MFWFTNLTQHETDDVILYIYSVHKHRGNSFKLQDYKMRLKQIRLNWINSMQVIKVLFTNVFFPGDYACYICFKRWYFLSSFTFPICWCNRYHRSWPFLECRPSKLYFKILWKYDDWSFRFHNLADFAGEMHTSALHESQNGRLFYITTAALITNIPLTSWCNEMIFTEKIEKELI